MDFSKRYKKYQWIEADLEENTSDPRPESYKIPKWDNIEMGAEIDTEKGTWATRKALVLKNVYTNLDTLIADAKDREKLISLAVFKPTKIKKFFFTPAERDWDPKKLAQFNQVDLFQEGPFNVVSKLPYKFKYVFEDDSGKTSTMMIEDWEVGALYWNCLKRHNGDEELACQKVVKQYWDNFALTKDLYFYLGTTQRHHFTAKNPFLIIGAFYPKL